MALLGWQVRLRFLELFTLKVACRNDIFQVSRDCLIWRLESLFLLGFLLLLLAVLGCGRILFQFLLSCAVLREQVLDVCVLILPLWLDALGHGYHSGQ